MVWEELVGHADRISQFERILAGDRLAHAYLFVGPSGIGKRTFALRLAQCLLCRNRRPTELDACGHCPPCAQVQALTHPDLFLVGCPEGKRELILDVFLGPKEQRGKAGLCYDLSRSPMAGGRKIAIIDDANLMNEASGNALLKTLEEPPPASVLILVATTMDGILPTIRSRCQIVRFDPLSADDVALLLLKNGVVDDPQSARETAILSEGSLALAAQLANPELRALRQLLYDGLSAKVIDSNTLSSRVLEAVESGGSDPGAQRQWANGVVRFCVEFYGNLLSELRADRSVQRAAAIPQVAQLADRLDAASDETAEVVCELLERSLDAETHLEQNTGITLCLETLLNELGRITRTRLDAPT